MGGYVNFVKKYRIWLAIALILISIFAVIGVFRMNLNPSFDIFVNDESVYLDNLEYMEENFPSSETLSIVVEFSGDELSLGILLNFMKLKTYLESIEGVSSVNGPVPGTGAGDLPAGYLNSISLDQIRMLEQNFSNMGKLSPLVIKDGKVYGIYQVFLAPSFENKSIITLEDWLSENEYTYYISGDMYMQQKIMDYLIRILTIVPPVALFLILFVFTTQIKSFKGTLLSVLPAAVGALWAVGAIGWSGTEVSIITILAPIFTLVIGSADGLHFVSHVQESRKEGSGRLKSIISTLKMVGIPMIITTVTSVAGFLALLAFNISTMKDLAIYTSIGITLAGIATWFVLPVILVGNINIQVRKERRKGNILNIRKLWGVPSIAITAVLLIASVIGLMFINTEFNMLMVYKDSTEVNQSFRKTIELNGGGIPVFLMYEPGGDPLSEENIKSTGLLQDKLDSMEYVSKTVSIYDAVKSAGITNQTELTSNPVIADNISNLLNIRKGIIRIMIFPTGFENKVLDGIESEIETFNRDEPDQTLRLTGMGYMLRDLNRDMLRKEALSLIIAFGLIILLLSVSLRKLIPAIIASVPIGITVVVLFGFLGISGMSLNLFTATIFCITIGVGIDYAVHYTSVFTEFRKQGHSKAESAELSYKYTSKPILANALGIAIGLSALFLSPLKMHTYVALLMWVSMICGVLLSLSFLPTVLIGRNTKNK